MSKVIRLGLGEMGASRDSEVVFVAFGLGSCVGVALYDEFANTGGMVHIVLANSQTASIRGITPVYGRFADTAIPKLIEDMGLHGARKSRIKAKIAGGADMFGLAGAKPGVPRIGEQNVAAVRDILSREGIPIIAQDVLGREGRTMQFFVKDSRCTVRTIGGQERAI
jgi:chemotaxis protein CheD